MSDSRLNPLKILVERAVRPMRASASRKRKVREELLAHVTSVFDQEFARDADERAALERTAQRFGNPAELTGQLQESVPKFDSFERFADWVSFRPGESTLIRAVRYTVFIEAVALLFLLFSAVLLRRGGLVNEWPIDVIWHTGLVLFLVGYLGFTIGFLESALRHSLNERKNGAWLQLALVLAGSTAVSMTLGLTAYGTSPEKVVWLFLFTVGIPTVIAWRLSLHFTARKRYHEDWASLPIAE